MYIYLPHKSTERDGHSGKFTIWEKNQHSVPRPRPLSLLCAVQLSPSLHRQLLSVRTARLLSVRGGRDKGAMGGIEETATFTDREGSYSTAGLHRPKLQREREREREREK